VEARAAGSEQRAGDPAAALVDIAAATRERGVLLAECVRDSDEVPALGLLVAAGPRAANAPGAFARVIESVREGYLLHYGSPRVVVTGDSDLALLAGDFMYAQGLSLLAALGDREAVAELAELISLCAQAHTDGAQDVPALWLASAMAIAAGGEAPHAEGKAALRAGAPAGAALWKWCSSRAAQTGLDEQLGAAAEAVGFPR
jgi:hypothetical protein